jgi:hypothetical protein
MKEICATLNQTSHEFMEKYENVELILYSTAVFLIPLLFSHPQMLTGTLVNAFLIMAALHFKGWKAAPIVILPSVAAVLSGVLFGPFTIFIVYMMPIIWIGNFVLVYLFKYLYMIKSLNYWAALGGAAVAKSALLFGAAFILVNASVIPAMFLTAMGILQLGTAIAGGIVAFGMRSAYGYLLK